MKKLVLMFAAAVMAVSASAQTVTESKTFDNFYLGVNGGLATTTRPSVLGPEHHTWLRDIAPNAGIRVGRWFTPVFGLALESNAYFKNLHHANVQGTLVNGLNTSLLATVNLSNWFGGYTGEPRCFEVIPVFGFGWGHTFGTPSANWKADALTSKLGVDLAFNLGAKRAWQFYVEPSINWDLNGNGYEGVAYNINQSMFQLNVGVNYKFKNSNGSHNFTLVKLRDQAEIDGLNAQINDLRNELAKKPKEVVKEVVKEAPAPQEVKVENLVFVTFAQGKTILTKEAKAALDGVAKGKHVQIVGTASPEGSKEINDKISQGRADAVAAYLSNRGVVVDEATGKGVQGTTSNRLAVVYVK
ncbi:MAG: OmpA family protein [Prevotellaceae bacterium]|nr:OmpA family protein [Prevotellaceae bacterium]